jgi:coproporphyrinogen III oxidase-like Fe-S oxidoreductase
MDKDDFPIALAIEDQYFLSQLLLRVPSPDIDPEQVARLSADGLIERSGKRWKLTEPGRTLLGEAPSRCLALGESPTAAHARTQPPGRGC